MATAYRPARPGERIVLVDVLRGFALLGILFDNVRSFSGYDYAPLGELALLGTFRLDGIVNGLIEVLVKGKFYRIFAILFGAGCFLQFSRHAGDGSFGAVYRRRLLVLLAIGVLHSLAWSGDILLMYALAGFVLLGLRRVPLRRQPWVAVALVFFFVLTDVAFFLWTAGGHAPFARSAGVETAHVTFPDVAPAAVVEAYRSNSPWRIFRMNLHHLAWKWLAKIPSGSFTTTAGLFLLGYWLAAKDFFTRRPGSARLLLGALAVGAAGTFLALRADGSMTTFPPDPWNTFRYKVVLGIGQLGLAFFYMAVVARLVAAGGSDGWISRRLAPVGRMALSNYLAQTVACIVVFYGIGLGLDTRAGLAGAVAVAGALLAVQVAWSRPWLRRYRFGPAEWAWRSLTYGRRLENRRAGVS